MLHPSDFFDLTSEIVTELFEECEYIWQAVGRIEEHVARLAGDNGSTILGDVMPGAYINGGRIYIAEGARIEPGAYVVGPAYIASGAVVRHGAYVRENVIMLQGSILGHASEAKNSILLPHAAAPHFNYVGDSILGSHVNLGAGTKLSNLTMLSQKDPNTGLRPTIRIEVDGVEHDTELAKLGAILGDEAQTGCNSVLNPGCLVGPRTLVYANLSLRKGYYPPDSIVKLCQETEHVNRK